MPSYPELKLYIGGEWKTTPGAAVINPHDESVLGTVPHATRDDLDNALAAAEQGFRLWSRTSPAKRAETIFAATRLMRDRIEGMAYAITLEQGKPIGQSRLEILRGCEIMEWDAQEGRRIYGRIIPSEPGMRHSVPRQPIGVVAAFSPWNFPMSSPARKVGGALSAGCSIILKASEETPAGAVRLARAFHDAGLPPGVLNLVFGKPSDISEYLIPRPSVRLVTFTGSVPVGKHLSAMAGAHMKPVIMELGGHSPVIVCDDVDPVSTAVTSAIGKSPDAGQVCVSPTRFFVEDKIYDRFAASFAERAAAMKVGNGLDPANQMGPLANERRVAAMEMLVADATAKGARVTAGGTRIGNRGYYFPLTVLADVPDDARDAGGTVWSAGTAQPGAQPGRSNRKSQFRALRFGRLRVHQQRAHRRSVGGMRRGRQSVDQSSCRVERRNTVRRCEGQWHRPGRRCRGIAVLYGREERFAPDGVRSGASLAQR